MPYRRLTKHADSLMHIYYGDAVCDCRGSNLCLTYEQLNAGIISLDVAHFTRRGSEGCAAPFSADANSIISANGIDYTLFDPSLKRRDNLIVCMGAAYCGNSCGRLYLNHIDVDKHVYRRGDICHCYAAIFAAIYSHYNRHHNSLRNDWLTVLLFALNREFAKFFFRIQIDSILKLRVSNLSCARNMLRQLHSVAVVIKDFLNEVDIREHGSPDVILPKAFSLTKCNTSLFKVLTSCFVNNPSMKKYGSGETIHSFMPVVIDNMKLFRNNRSFLEELGSYLSKMDKFIQDELTGIIHCASEWDDIKVCTNRLLTIPSKMIISA